MKASTYGAFTVLIEQFQPAEIIAAAPDAIAMALGENVRNAHPLAQDMAGAPLSSLAAAIERKNTRPGSQVRAASLGTWDFTNALAAGVQGIITRRFEAAAGHRRFCGETEVLDFKRVDMPELDIADELPIAFELGEIPNEVQGLTELNLRIDGCIRNARVVTFARRLGVSWQVVKNDQIGLIADLIRLLGNSAARTEAGLLYRELELNPALDDGLPVFIDGANWIKSPLSETSLGAGVAAMRTFQTISGNNADLAAAHLLVAADLEVAARKLVHESGLPIEITATAQLATGHWYLFSDPEIHPACTTLKLRGAAQPVRAEAGKKFYLDGTYITARADLGAVVRGRMGIVRGQPA
ncbi:MAG: hypothetical protein FHK80_00810 [Azoarcus sp. PHD]|nr:MAG: hypothetical protein FHK80_00810 [Azoarcus sp. PHD]